MIKKLGADEVIVVDKELKALNKVKYSFDALLNTLPVNYEGFIDAYISTLKPKGKLL